jgi:hypothetical protein
MESQYKQIFACESGALPFRYFSVVHYRKLSNLNLIESHFVEASWRSKLLSYVDPRVLTLPIYAFVS